MGCPSPLRCWTDPSHTLNFDRSSTTGCIAIVEPRITAWDADQSMSWWAPELSADPGRHREVGEQAEAVEEEGNQSDVADRTQQNRLRGDVVDRLALACRRHARHRADREWERGHPISQHIIVFFYREPGSAEAPDLLRIATRIFLAGDDVDDLPSIVAQLYALSREYLAMGRFDPREQLSTRVEPMTSNAQYVGLGAATLDPYDIQRESYLPDERHSGLSLHLTMAPECCQSGLAAKARCARSPLILWTSARHGHAHGLGLVQYFFRADLRSREQPLR